MDDLGADIQAACWMAAFWTAVLGFRSAGSGREAGLRWLGAIVLVAIFAHLGWALLYLDLVLAHEASLLVVAGGATCLFAPLGPLLVAPWRDEPARVREFLGDAFAALSLALAVAKLGCLAAGCCGGVMVGSGLRHPTVVYEGIGYLCLHRACRWGPSRLVPALFLAGFGALRLAVEPLRQSPALGAPTLTAESIASVWILLGLAAAAHSCGKAGRAYR
jgi:hypothetical protein